MAEKVRLYEHPEYTLIKDDLTKWRDLYEGRHDVLTSEKYLWPHRIEKTKEGASFWADRQQRTRYLNISEVLISLWTSFLFKKPIPMEGIEELFGGELDNVDGFGTSLECLIKHGFLFQLLNYGRIFTFITSPDSSRPYIDLIDAPNVVDWQVEAEDPARIGRYNFVRYEEKRVRPRVSAESAPTEILYSASHEIQNGGYEIRQYEIEAEKHMSFMGDKEFSRLETLTPGTNSGERLPEIPVAILMDESWVKDAAEESLRYHNLRSTKDNIQHVQGYQDKWLRVQNINDGARIDKFGEHSVTILQEGEEMGSLDPVNTGDYQVAVGEALRTAFQVGLNQLRSLPSDSRETQTAEAIQEEKQNTIQTAHTALRDLEDYTKRVIENYAFFKGRPDFEADIDFNQKIEIRDVDTMIKLRQVLLDSMLKVPDWNKADLISFVREQDYSDEDKQEIIDGIESTDFANDASANPFLQDRINGLINGRREADSPEA